MSSRVRNDFHAHLDVCAQCANHPFALCAEGARLLELAASLTHATTPIVVVAYGKARK